GLTYRRGEEAGLLDAVFFPKLKRGVFKSLQQGRQAAGQTAVNTHFVDHGHFPFLLGAFARGLIGHSAAAVPHRRSYPSHEEFDKLPTPGFGGLNARIPASIGGGWSC